MGMEDLVERILSDAEAESKAILEEAEKTAQSILSDAQARAESAMQVAQASAEAKAKLIADSSAATARLDGAKILLSAKRGVIDDVYGKALAQICAMERKDYIAFMKSLLEKYADNGDEVILPDKFAYSAEISALDVVKKRGLKLTFGGAGIKGGFILRGEKSDKDLSVEAMIAADRAEHESEVAAEVFRP